MTHLRLVLLVALGVAFSPATALLVGIAWGYWRASLEPRPVTTIQYVDRVVPRGSEKPVPTSPPAEQDAR